jgi:hypothetical protein
MIRVVLPHHLQTLARCDREVSVPIDGVPTQRSVLDALEAQYPMLRGTVREHVTLKRRPRVRFFAGGEDITHESPDARLPGSVADGEQPFMIVGAVAGG